MPKVAVRSRRAWSEVHGTLLARTLKVHENALRVAATKTPIIFIGTGEHLHDLERFSPGPFISKMLGMGDMQGFMEQMRDVQESVPQKKQEEMRERIERGEFTMRDLRDQLTNISKMCVLFATSPAAK